MYPQIGGLAISSARRCEFTCKRENSLIHNINDNLCVARELSDHREICSRSALAISLVGFLSVHFLVHLT